jgi:hypothetical protein
MWKDILKNKKRNKLIWNFDSTGCVMKPVAGNKKPFLYTMCWHDENQKLINNIYDFISCSHTAVSISNYLNNFKANLLLYGEPSKIFPYGICTDCCFAFINSYT